MKYSLLVVYSRFVKLPLQSVIDVSAELKQL